MSAGPNTETRRHRALADERRARIVAELGTAPGGLDLSELTRRLGQHPNTLRWHLGILGDAGLVTAAAEPRLVPGRPRLVYRLGKPSSPSHGDEYRLLASMLADTLSRDPAGPDVCEAAGRAWGAGLVAGRRGEKAVEAVVEILDAQGFEPRAREQAIEMHRCPFQELAEANPRVVCAVHRGLIDGALAELGSTQSVAELEVFPRPNVCVARLDRRKEAAS